MLSRRGEVAPQQKYRRASSVTADYPELEHSVRAAYFRGIMSPTPASDARRQLLLPVDANYFFPVLPPFFSLLFSRLDRQSRLPSLIGAIARHIELASCDSRMYRSSRRW